MACGRQTKAEVKNQRVGFNVSEAERAKRLEERVRRHVARFDERTISTARKTRARIREASAMEVKVDSVTRGVMERLEVPSLLRGALFNFGRRVLSLATRYGGLTLQYELALVRNRWMARGIAPEVLDEVRSSVERAVERGELSRF